MACEEDHEADLNKIRSICERVQTFFPDFLLIARNKDKDALFVKSSNRDWARLAAERYVESVKNESLLADLAKLLSEAREQGD